MTKNVTLGMRWPTIFPTADTDAPDMICEVEFRSEKEYEDYRNAMTEWGYWQRELKSRLPESAPTGWKQYDFALIDAKHKADKEEREARERFG